MTDSTPTDELAMDLLPGLREAASREDSGLRRIRSWSTTRRRATSLVLLLSVALLVLFTTPRPDMDAVPWNRFLIGIGLTVTAAVWAVRTFLHPLQDRRPREAALVIGGAALLLLPVAFALLPPAHDAVHAHPESFAGTGADFVPRALACLVFGLLAGVPVAAFLFLADRRPPASAGRIALAAGAGGATGTLGLLLHCPLVGGAHRVAGHGFVAVALAVLVATAIWAVGRASSQKNPAAP